MEVPASSSTCRVTSHREGTRVARWRAHLLPEHQAQHVRDAHNLAQ